MRKSYSIENFKHVNDELYLILNEKVGNLHFQPANQVIADSDDFAFVYLVDTGDAYSYIRFPQVIWPQLVGILQREKDPMLTWGDQSMTLNGFYEELKMLVYNIEGNNNYGAEFSSAVEEAFALFLRSNEV